MLGVDETQKRSLFAKPTMKNRSAVFTLGSRGAVVAEVEAPIIVPHAAVDNKMRYDFYAPDAGTWLWLLECLFTGLSFSTELLAISFVRCSSTFGVEFAWPLAEYVY